MEHILHIQHDKKKQFVCWEALMRKTSCLSSLCCIKEQTQKRLIVVTWIYEFNNTSLLTEKILGCTWAQLYQKLEQQCIVSHSPITTWQEANNNCQSMLLSRETEISPKPMHLICNSEQAGTSQHKTYQVWGALSWTCQAQNQPIHFYYHLACNNNF